MGGEAQIVAQDPLACAELIHRLYEQPMLSAPAFCPGGTAIGMCRSPASPRAFPEVFPRESQEGFLGQISPSAMYPAADSNPWSRSSHQGQRVDFGVALPELGQAPQVVAQTGLVSQDSRRPAVFLQEHGATQLADTVGFNGSFVPNIDASCHEMAVGRPETRQPCPHSIRCWLGGSVPFGGVWKPIGHARHREHREHIFHSNSSRTQPSVD